MGHLYLPAVTLGAPLRAPKRPYIPPKSPAFVKHVFDDWSPVVPSSNCHLKPLFFFHLPSLGPGHLYLPSVTLGAPLRAPKRPYISPKSPAFVEHVFWWLKSCSAILKWSPQTFIFFPSTQFGAGPSLPTICNPGGPPQSPKRTIHIP